MDLSLVIPVYNEEKNLPALFDSICNVLVPLEYDWEIILVDDGSRDRSLQVLKEFAVQDEKHVRVISFRRNFGQTAAIAAGIDHAKGATIVLLDADMQNDPADIPMLLAKLDEAMTWSAAGARSVRTTPSLAPCHRVWRMLSLTMATIT